MDQENADVGVMSLFDVLVIQNYSRDIGMEYIIFVLLKVFFLLVFEVAGYQTELNGLESDAFKRLVEEDHKLTFHFAIILDKTYRHHFNLLTDNPNVFP